LCQGGRPGPGRRPARFRAPNARCVCFASTRPSWQAGDEAWSLESKGCGLRSDCAPAQTPDTVPSCSRPSDRRTTRQTSLQAEKKLRPETAWMHGSTRRAGYPMVSRRCRRWLRWMLTPEDLGGSHRLRHRAGVGGGLPPHPAGDPSLARRGVRAIRVTTRLGLCRSYEPPWPRRRLPDSPIPFASLARAASSGRCWTRSLQSP